MSRYGVCCARSPLKSSGGASFHRRAISSRTSAAARIVSSRCSRANSASCSRRKGAAAGSATAPSSSYVRPMQSARPLRMPSTARIASPPTGTDQLRPDQLQLPLAPEGAELLLAGRRRPISATRRRASGIATGHRRAVERPVEVVFVQLEPAAKRLAGATAPRATLCSFDDARRLPVHVRALVEVLVHDGPATRADSRLRHTPGRRERRVAARRASGRTNGGASSARDEEPVALEQKLAAELLRKILALERRACTPASASRP